MSCDKFCRPEWDEHSEGCIKSAEQQTESLELTEDEISLLQILVRYREMVPGAIQFIDRHNTQVGRKLLIAKIAMQDKKPSAVPK